MKFKAFGNKPGGGFGKHEDPRPDYAQVNERFLECSKCGFRFDEDAKDQGLAKMNNHYAQLEVEAQGKN